MTDENIPSFEGEAFEAEVARFAVPEYLADISPNGGVVVRRYPHHQSATDVKLQTLAQVLAFIEERLPQGFPVTIGGLQ